MQLLVPYEMECCHSMNYLIRQIWSIVSYTTRELRSFRYNQCLYINFAFIVVLHVCMYYLSIFNVL